MQKINTFYSAVRLNGDTIVVYMLYMNTDLWISIYHKVHIWNYDILDINQFN